MSVAPTLRCDCEGRFLSPTFEYLAAPAGETAFDLGSQSYKRGYDRCRVCDHWFGRHQLDLSQLYERDYVTATYGGIDGLRRRFDFIMALPPKQSDNAARLARVNGFSMDQGLNPGSGLRLLDVGAGLGVFPAAAKCTGWRVTAIDLDARMISHISDVVGVEAKQIDLFSMDVATHGKFDAITFNKVLEHIEDPVAVLSKSSELLNSSGFVYVEVPDVAAAADGLGREEFFIEHHHVFSPASVAQMAERAGFSIRRIERLREPSGKFTLSAFFREK